jgi:hypothetical protein
VDDQGRLKEILVVCKKCGSKIILEGFELLSEIEESEGLSDTENV